MSATPFVTHQNVGSFAEDRVNLPAADAQRHRDQVNGLRARLETKIDADPDYGLIKMLHAGSVAKGTALRAVNDLDVAVYVESANAPEDDPDLIPGRRKVGRGEPVDGAKAVREGEHCVTVNFRGSGLNVDVVPVLYEE